MMNDVNTNTMLDQAYALLDTGQYPLALNLFIKICEQDSGVAEAWLMRGAIHGEMGQIDDAIRNIQQAIAVDSSYEEAYLTLAQIYTSQNKLAEAIELCEKAVHIDPAYTEAWIKLSGLYGLLDNLEQAEHSSREAIKLSPENAEANVNLANALFGQHKITEAIDAFNTALRYSPDLPQLYTSLGNCYLHMERNEQGMKSFQHVLDLKPDDADAYYHIAIAHERMGKFDEALVNYDKAISIDGKLSHALIAKAGLFEQMGDFEAARLLIQKIIDAGDGSASAAVCYSRIAMHYDDYKQAETLLKTAISNINIKQSELISLYNALGSVYDRTGQYDKAFESYHKSNANQRYNYMHDEQIKYNDKIINAYSKENISKLPKSSIQSEMPVFIIGMPRSGTSLVEQILASHPEVYGGGELHDIRNIIENMPQITALDDAYPYHVAKLNSEIIDQFTERYISERQSIAPEVSRFTDKTPHNFQHLGLIKQFFPNAHIIHCLRNPVDNCLSCYFTDFRGQHGYSYDLVTLGQHYNEHLRIMSHWKDTLNIPMLTVRYEDVVADLEAMSRKIIDFVGLDWSDQCLHFYETPRHTLTHSYDQVRKPIYTKSVGRWKNYSNYLNPLLDTLNNYNQDLKGN